VPQRRTSPLGRALQLATDAADLVHHRRSVFALGLQLADLLRQAVAACLQLLGAGLDRLALGFERGEALDVEKRLRRLAPLQTSDDLRQILAQQIDVEHGQWLRAAQPVRHWSADCRQCAAGQAGRGAGPSGHLRLQRAAERDRVRLGVPGFARIAEHTRRAVGAAPALGCHAEVELQAFEAVRAVGRGLADLLVGDPAAHTNDHDGPVLRCLLQLLQLTSPICACR
jgi:hypothetical protein